MENIAVSTSEQSSTGCHRLLIAGPMTLSTARDWRQCLLAANGAAGDVELDLSGVSDIDAAGIQSLVSLRQQARNSARSLHLLAASACVREALDFCRLTEFFEIPPPARA